MENSLQSNHKGLLIIVIIGGLLYVGGQYVGSLPLKAQQQEEAKREISVTGKSELEIKPDIAMVSLGVTTGPVASADVARTQLEDKFEAIMKAVADLGIAEEDVKTTNISINPVYDYSEGRQTIRGYEASETVEVKIRDVKKAGEVISKTTGEGVNQVGGISFTNEDEDVLLEQAQEEAIKNAREKAEKLASALDVKLGRVKSFSPTSQPPIFEPKFLTTEADGRGGDTASLPISPGTQKIIAEVTVVYELR